MTGQVVRRHQHSQVHRNWLGDTCGGSRRGFRTVIFCEKNNTNLMALWTRNDGRFALAGERIQIWWKDTPVFYSILGSAKFLEVSLSAMLRGFAGDRWVVWSLPLQHFLSSSSAERWFEDLVAAELSQGCRWMQMDADGWKTYLPHEAVAAVSKDKTPIGEKCEIQLVWISVDLGFNWFEVQLMCDSTDLRFHGFEITDSIGLRFKWFGCQLISTVLKINWFEIQLLWDSTALKVNWFETPVLSGSSDLRFNCCESQVIWESSDLRLSCFEIQTVWLSNDLRSKWFAILLLWDSSDLVVN